MTCKEAEALIPQYLQDNLDADELKSFLEHIDSCPDCKEELSIQFLIEEGLNSLSTGDSYDLQSAMNDRVLRSRKAINFHEKLFRLRNLGIFLVFTVIVILISIMFFYYG